MNSDLTPATIDKIVELSSATEVIEHDGAKFTNKHQYELKAEPDPLPSTIEVNTLSGFAKLIQEGVEAKDAVDVEDLTVERGVFSTDNAIVYVKDFQTVELIAKYSDDDGRRRVYFRATPVKFEQFPFNSFIDQEKFIIGVASRFADGGDENDKAYVLQVASSITNEALSVSEDNGFSQRATIKAGLKMAEKVVLKAQVKLAPFRTFPEIGQPTSAFVFRARGGEQPSFMLVEADGGRWKIDAMRELQRQLATMIDELEIVA